MPATDLPLLIEAARAAGDIARGFTGPDTKGWEKPDGSGPVTLADLAVNEVLEKQLRGARPDYGWLSEESDDNADRLARDKVFIIDPIDGTRSFIEGSSTWAHSIAVVEQGKVTAAVVYLPMLDKLYAAGQDIGATLNDAPMAAKAKGDAEILAARPTMQPQNWPRGVPNLRRSYRPSLAYRLALVAEGKFGAMITLRKSWEWDIAAGDLILREAGAVTSDREGGALVFNNPDPRVNGVVAAGPQLHADLTHKLGV